ncbi:AAA family ATPase [Fundidesulfovibrio soli]|uniref:AAA family ATPase n=1 Tax=Fundidesulfovibrio soli TaxID=2922716 RepID=UPI001FAF3EF7|nr:AAA family ATPase [Fundidesulfovibrio soli]
MDTQIKVCIEVADKAASKIIYGYMAAHPEFSIITTYPYYADIYIIEIGNDFGKALMDLRNFLEINPALEIFVISGEASHSRILEFVNAGARGYFLLPLSANKFEASLDVFIKRFKKDRSRVDMPCRVVSFLGAKGGVGTTSICTNTALLLQLSERNTLLMDLHQPLGDAHVILDMTPVHTIGYLVREVHRLDTSLLTNVAAKHRSGLSVLPPISHHNEIPLASIEAMSSILEVARGYYQYITIDHGSGLSEIDIALLNSSDYIMIVIQADVQSLRNAKLLIKFLTDYNETFPSKIHFIVNRYDSNSKLSLEDIAKFVGTDVFHTIPNDYKRVSSCCQSGALLYEDHPDAKITKAFTEMVTKLTANHISVVPTHQPKQGSFLSKLFNRG